MRWRVPLEIKTKGHIEVEAGDEAEAFAIARRTVKQTEDMFKLVHQHGGNHISLGRNVQLVEEEEIQTWTPVKGK